VCVRVCVCVCVCVCTGASLDKSLSILGFFVMQAAARARQIQQH
jgi:hypothetical protein